MTEPSTPAASASPFAWTADHTAVRVPDFEAAVAWYSEKLDFRMKQTWVLGAVTYAYLHPENDDRFSIELLAGPGAEPRPAFADLHESYGFAGWHHVCLRVVSVADTTEELRRRGVKIVSEPHDVAVAGLTVAFFCDPWGNLFELAQPMASAG
ncbi:VOC family protein [Phenylobacterium sp.]|uniref:VOC family protein n=1 Tax=Phenylobacterium sp. TaxID=1871053 RepID=UPI001203932C|nr:VOC family protein [Phenylobacterium sp.]THD60582.1 MAG: VOC family protein [Phenylobacterium sp.]